MATRESPGTIALSNSSRFLLICGTSRDIRRYVDGESRRGTAPGLRAWTGTDGRSYGTAHITPCQRAGDLASLDHLGGAQRRVRCMTAGRAIRESFRTSCTGIRLAL